MTRPPAFLAWFLAALLPGLTASGAEAAVQARLLHPSLVQQIGVPAVVAPGAAYPSLEISLQTPPFEFEVELRRRGDETPVPSTLAPGNPLRIDWEGRSTPGIYDIEVRTLSNGALAAVDTYTFTVINPAALPRNHSLAAHPGPAGRIVYVPDFRGNRIPDFSGVGYGGGATPPELPVRVTLEPMAGDATARIQAAIDQVSALEPDANGWRGAVLLRRGIHEVDGTLKLHTGGVVLRGEGQGDRRTLWLNPAARLGKDAFAAAIAGRDATVLLATGSERRPLIQIRGASDVAAIETSASEILDAYLPVGANHVHVQHPQRFAPGDRIVLQRRGNAAWITAIGMDAIPPRSDGGTITQWEPFDLNFEFTVTAVEGNRIRFSSSLVNAVEQRWGGDRVMLARDSGRIRNAGVEHLRAISFWQVNRDGVDDTRHADRFILITNARDCWVRSVTAEHFYTTGGAFMLSRSTYAITVENCSNLIAPRTFYAGRGYDSSGRTFAETGIYVGRYGFSFNGQNGLVRDCFALSNRHAFVAGSRVTGPNVFIDCVGEDSLTYSEPHHRWSTGGLYDNVHDTIALMNRLSLGTGHD